MFLTFKTTGTILSFKSIANNMWIFGVNKLQKDLDSIALVRAVECTNGIVQYSYRDGDP